MPKKFVTLPEKSKHLPASLLRFMGTERTAVVSLPIDRAGTIHIAALGFVHLLAPLRLYFVTNKNSEKCRLLLDRESVPAACVVGAVPGTLFTLQMRGAMKIVTPRQHEVAVEAYYAKRQNHKDDLDDPDSVLLEFTPDWARYTDYSQGWQNYMLDLT